MSVEAEDDVDTSQWDLVYLDQVSLEDGLSPCLFQPSSRRHFTGMTTWSLVMIFYYETDHCTRGS